MSLCCSKLDVVIGYYIEDEIVIDIFICLGLNVIFVNNIWIVVFLSWCFDIEIEEDLIEEVACIYGYNNILNNLLLVYFKMKGMLEKLLEVICVCMVLVDSDY